MVPARGAAAEPPLGAGRAAGEPRDPGRALGPGHRSPGREGSPWSAAGPGGSGRALPPAPLAAPAPRPGLAAPALMRSIKRIIDVEVCCEVLAGGKRSSALQIQAL